MKLLPVKDKLHQAIGGYFDNLCLIKLKLAMTFTPTRVTVVCGQKSLLEGAFDTAKTLIWKLKHKL